MGYNENLNAYYEVISYTKLLSDAQKRNLVLFEKLNLPHTMQKGDSKILPGISTNEPLLPQPRRPRRRWS